MEERRANSTEGSQTIPELKWAGLTSGGRGLELPWCLFLAPADMVRLVPGCAWAGLILEDVQAGPVSKLRELILGARGQMVPQKEGE